NHVAEPGELAALAVDIGGKLARIEVVELVARDQPGPDRAESIQALAKEPLPVPLLQGPRGHVVDDGEAEDVVESLGALHAYSASPDDDAQFAFVVDRIGRIRRCRNPLKRVGKGCHGLGEDDRIPRYLLPVAGRIDPAAREFTRVIVIILADTDDILR